MCKEGSRRTSNFMVRAGSKGLNHCKAILDLLQVDQAQQTSSNLLKPHEIERCVEFFNMSSGWFGTSSNLLKPHYYRESKVFRVLTLVWESFKCIIHPQTFSNHIITEITRSLYTHTHYAQMPLQVN